MNKPGGAAWILAGLMIVSGCKKAVEEMTGPTPVTITTQYFSGTLAPHTSHFYSFTATQSGTLTVMLASVTTTAGVPLAVEAALGFGVPEGSGCGVTLRVRTEPMLLPQIVEAIEPGVYCIEVGHLGQPPSPVNFALRFSHP